MITIDRSIQFQQNMAGRQISILIFLTASSAIEDIAPLIPLVLEALRTIQPGEIVVIN